MLLGTLVLMQLTGVAMASHVLFQPYAYGISSRLKDHIRLAEVLVDLGHNVTVLINEQDRKYMEQRLPDVTYLDYSTAPNSSIVQDFRPQEHLLENRLQTLMAFASWLRNVHMTACGNLLDNKALVQRLTSTHYDLYMCDVADLCSKIISSMLDLPTVAYTSHGAIPDAVFFPNIMAISPAMLSPVSDDMDFTERFVSGVAHILTHLVFLPMRELVMQRFINERNITLKKPLDCSFVEVLVLVGNDVLMEYPRPFMPNIISVGGWFIDPPKPLTGDLKTFVEHSGYQGTVYFSFGTVIETPSEGKVFLRAFSKFPNYRFIWKYNGPPIQVPNNVLQIKWAPQNDLLAHPKMKMFITHCGSHSSHEAIHHGVPVVAIPLLVDQPSNAHRLTHRLHMGVLVDYQTMTEPILVDAINEVLSNNTYKANAMRARSLRQDQQTTPLSRVKFYIDYVIRHKGIGLLASKPLSKLSLMQLCSLDVIFVMILLLVTIVAVLCAIIKCLITYIISFCLHNRKEKHKVQ